MQGWTHKTINASLDGVIWAFIIIASIIAQIVKASRNRQAPPAPPEQPRTPETDTSAEADLRRFLESLSGQETASRPPRPEPTVAARPSGRTVSGPPPVPAAVTPVVPAPGKKETPPSLRVVKGQGPRKAERPERTPKEPALRVLKPSIAVRPGAVADAPPPGSGRRRFVSRVLSAKDLKGTQRLRKAIALREVFGPPVGLRPPGLTAPAEISVRS